MGKITGSLRRGMGMLRLMLLSVLLLALTAGCLPVSAASWKGIVDYNDVDRYAEIRTYVDWANVSGVLPGTSVGRFSPNGALTRGALIKALWRMSGSPSVSATLPFRDAASMSVTARKAVSWAYASRILTKAPYFYASRAATRQNCAVYVYRYARLRGCGMSAAAELSGYSDAAPLPAYARTAFRWVIGTGILPAATSGRLYPSSAVKRSEAARMLYMLHRQIPNYRRGLGAPESWNAMVLREIAEVADFGGYYTGSSSAGSISTERAMSNAFRLDGNNASIDMDKARPSYCSSACYMLLLKALSEYNGSRLGASAWACLRPYTVSGMGYPPQEDGVGCWGRANSNGPGMAVLIKELGAGSNVYIGNRSEYASSADYWNVWGRAVPGDFLKIFRSNAIGASERGHMVVYLGSKYATRGGVRDDYIFYWSSTGGSSSEYSGYGIASCRASEIYRGVLTKITSPSAFARAVRIPPTDKDSWLASLIYSRNISVAEMKEHI